MSRKLELKTFKKIYLKYKQGKSAAYLTRHYGISRTLFYRYVKRIESKKKLYKLDNDQRLELIQKVVRDGKKVSHVTRQAKVSRTIFYRWKARHDEAGEGEKLYSLNPKTPQRGVHPKKASTEVEKEILEIVSTHPELSTHKIAQLFFDHEHIRIGNHGIQNILSRYNLSTYALRNNFAESYRIENGPKPVVQPSPTWSFSQKALRLALSPFATVPKLAFNHPVISSLVVVSVTFILLYDLPAYERAGIFLALVALACGLIFFAYSLKYYFTLALILGFSQRSRNRETSHEKNKKSLLARVFNFDITKNNTLESDLSQINLTRKPFVSIHVPFYNEKRVAERILLALSNLDWPNFEVIVADDSTDETKEIVARFVKSDPRIKVSRRNTRSGYKGAALAKALEITDIRAEYVLVFDSDFIPFPDTVEQFMKYFAHLAKGDIDSVENINTAAVQGYQWHVLNKSENWVTRGIRTEYAGNYIIERSGVELYGGLKQIAGSVFCIRRSVLEKMGWTSSITEDFNLTLRLYEAGYKVAYTPYIQAPSECVSTVRRLIRQRMRWAEGHSFNVAQMFRKIMGSEKVTGREKFEFLYLSPYYLQAAFFIVGTFGWLLSEIVFKTHLPYWTSLLGWSLVFSNFISLPLTNSAGLFLEESEEKDYLGIGSFAILSYVLVPFQAYASIKGFLEKEEGTWFRTPKTGRITDSFAKSHLSKFLGNFFPWRKERKTSVFSLSLPAFATANQKFLGYTPKVKRLSFVSRSAIVVLLLVTMFINYLAFFTPAVKAALSSTPSIEQQINIIDQEYATTSADTTPSNNSLGIFTWDTSKYDGTIVAKFEAVMHAGNSNIAICSAWLYSVGGSQVTGSQVNTNANTAYLRATSGDISANLTTGTNYTVRFGVNFGNPGTCSINSARLIVVQTNGTKLTKTEAQVEIGNNTGQSATTYTDLTNYKVWKYDSSKFSPAPTAYFEASMASPASTITKAEQQVEIINGVPNGSGTYTNGIACIDTTKYTSPTYYYEVVATNSHVTNDETVTFQYNNGGGSSCSNATGQTTTTVTVTKNNGTNAKRFRSTAITLTSGQVILTAKGADVTVYAARVIIQQSSGSALTATQNQVEFFNDQLSGNIGNNYTADGNCDSEFYYDSSKYQPAPSAIYFEGTLKTTSGTAYMQLYDQTTGSAVSSSEVTNATSTLTRVRSSAITLTSGHEYTIQIKNSAGIGSWVNGKVILEQNATILATEMFHKNINHQMTATTSYANTNFDNKYDTSVLSGTIAPYFEADLGSDGDPATAQAYDKTSSTAVGSSEVTSSNAGKGCGPTNRVRTSATVSPTTGDDIDTQIKGSGEFVTNSWLVIQICTCVFAELRNLTDSTSLTTSEVTTNTGSWVLVRSASITLTTGKDYYVQMHASGTNSGLMANAKVILDQNDSNGITAFETYQMQVNTNAQTNSASYVTTNTFLNNFDDTHFSGTVAYFFEGTISGQNKSSPTRVATDFTILRNATDSENVTASTTSEISLAGGTVTRVRSGQLTSGSSAGNLKTGKNYDTFQKCTSTSGGSPSNCVTDSDVGTTFSSWLIIQISSMPVPEAVLFLLPVIFFLPFIIKKLKMQRSKQFARIDFDITNAI